MDHLAWSVAEKRIARAVFDRAVDAELADLLAEFQRRVAALDDPRDMWPLADWLDRNQREFDEKYDYRYSRLPYVFARLIREGRVAETELTGLGDDKLEIIRRAAALDAPLTRA